MVAFKTHSQIPEAQRPVGVPLDYPAIASFIKSMPSGVEKDIAWQNWEYSNEFLRSNPLISQMAPLLGLTQSHLDQLFILAGSRQV